MLRDLNDEGMVVMLNEGVAYLTATPEVRGQTDGRG